MELITGGTGILGSHLLLELTAAGKRVRALVRAGSDRRIVERVFRHYRADAATLLERIEWVEGDLHDMPALQDAMQG
ncbi:MAG: SDR family oxidoreductase, partial [Flavobacteriales bacterium]